MAEIWKYEIEVADEATELVMPEGAEFLGRVEATSYGTLLLWATVDPARTIASRRVRVYGTGQTFDPEVMQYVGTARAGILIWHVFEVAGRGVRG